MICSPSIQPEDNTDVADRLIVSTRGTRKDGRRTLAVSNTADPESGLAKQFAPAARLAGDHRRPSSPSGSSVHICSISSSTRSSSFTVGSSTNMRPIALPFELRRKVALECLEPSTIAALALAHSAWTCPCEEILYDHVALVLDFFDQPILQFLRTMITRSQKALLVRTFWIVAGDTRSFSQWDMYCDALTQMHGLVNLRVPPSSNGLPHHLLQTVQQGSFKLRFLALPLSAQKSYDLMTRLTCALAPHAGTLRALGHFQEAYFIKKTPPDALQHLSEYGTVFGLISALGVNIYHCLYPTATDVEWARHLRNVRAAVLPDTSSAVTVRHLAITFHSEHYAQIPRLARLIAAAFPDVHSLVLRALVPPSHAGSVPLTDYDTIFACLSPFAARLRELFLECEWTHPIPGLQRAPVITDLDGLELLTRVDTEGCRQLNYAVLPYAKVYYRYGDDPCGWDEEEWDQRQSPVGSSP